MTKEELLNNVFEAALRWNMSSPGKVPEDVKYSYYDATDRAEGSGLIDTHEIVVEAGKAYDTAKALLK